MTQLEMDRRSTRRTRVARWLLAVFMMFMGLAHFLAPEGFVRAMPPWLPWHLGLVYLSGVFEILGGLGLLIPRARRAAAWGLIALFVAVFPANVHMALHADELGIAPWILWARLPFQPLFMAWAYRVRRSDGDHAA